MSALSTFYTGQSDLITIQFNDSSGVAIPHSEIEDVRWVFRHSNGDTVLKCRKVAPTGWQALTTHADAGKYTFEVLEEMGKNWVNGEVYLEWWLKLTDTDFTEGYKPIGEMHLYDVVDTNYSDE